MQETWRLLETWDREPGFNMAVDEALLLVGAPAPPTLRFYTWKPDALSLGYFQRLADLPQVHEASVCVRRLTGGGAIHHANELTFSIASSLEHPLYRGEIGRSYERVHGILQACFAQLGVESNLRGETPLRSDVADSGMCFHNSTPLDLAWGARKGVGSAQRRTRGRVLHHGSIKLAPTALDVGVAGLYDATPELTPQILAGRIRAQFEQALGIAFEASGLLSREGIHARERSAFFTSADFVGRR